MAGREAPRLPLRGARGSAARFPAMALELDCPQKTVMRKTFMKAPSEGPALGMTERGGTTDTPAGGPRERCPFFSHDLRVRRLS